MRLSPQRSNILLESARRSVGGFPGKQRIRLGDYPGDDVLQRELIGGMWQLPREAAAALKVSCAGMDQEGWLRGGSIRVEHDAPFELPIVIVKHLLEQRYRGVDRCSGHPETSYLLWLIVHC